MLRTCSAFLLLLTLTAGTSAQAAIFEYYVGKDKLPTFASGAYAGLPNPNFDRLTLLIAHGSHYHRIGDYSYTGTVPNQIIQPTSSNNRLPEISSGLPGLEMAPGAGLYAGKLVTYNSAEEYDDLTFRSTQALDGYAPASPEFVLFNSSSQRWNGTLDDTNVALQLVSKSAGLGIGTDSLLNVLNNPGDQLVLGDGNSLLSKLNFYVDGATPAGTNFTAQFKLVNLGTSSIQESGVFNFDLQAVPEPSSILLSVVGVIGGGIAVLRRKSLRTNAQRVGSPC
ncbi:MAG: all3515 family Zur-repressed PEP-CTERM protein [Planctomycetota bacterium]|nr:all3515 family Zur-repressed PEP-CTERM protein [Planctomycetota bacterium]